MPPRSRLIHWTHPAHLVYVLQTRGCSRAGALQALSGERILNPVDRSRLQTQPVDSSNIVFGKGPGAVAVRFGWRLKAGPISHASDGNFAGTIALPGMPGLVFSQNQLSGETSWGISWGWGSLQLGRKGSDGKDNFIKISFGVDWFATPFFSAKVSTPTFTPAGMTSAIVKEF